MAERDNKNGQSPAHITEKDKQAWIKAGANAIFLKHEVVEKLPDIIQGYLEIKDAQ